jgi:hypothetical protein
VNVLTILVFALVPVAAIWFIHRYAVNVIINDQWTDIDIIRRAHSGSLSFAALWAQHNENRILFPNLIVLVLAYTTHFNIVVEDYLSLVLLSVTTGLLIMAHKRRCPSMQWIWYFPVILSFLSFDVLASALFGFLFSWFLVLLALAIAIYLLDRPVLTWLALSAAVCAAVIGSFSSLQGLLIWPTGLVLLYLRRRSMAFALVWMGSAVTACTLYFLNFNFAASGEHDSYVLGHPLAAAKYYFFAVGDVIGVRLQPAYRHSGAQVEVHAAGVLIVAIAVWAIVHGFRSGRSGASPIGVALIVFGLLFIASITLGRLPMGESNASRYLPFEVTIWVGAYLALFDRPVGWSHDERSMWALRVDYLLGIRTRRPGDDNVNQLPPLRWQQLIRLMGRLTLIGIIIVQIVSGPYIGLIDARGWHRREVKVAHVTLTINQASDGLVETVLGSYSAQFIRQMANFARQDELSLFASPTSGRGSEGSARDQVAWIPERALKLRSRR